MKLIKITFFLSFIFFSFNSYGSEASNWLKIEIDKILIAYHNPNHPNQNRFLLIEQTINNNFEYEVGYRLNKNTALIARIDEEKLFHLNYRLRYHY